jgi:tRNA pseudouridine38-40 synthase
MRAGRPIRPSRLEHDNMPANHSVVRLTAKVAYDGTDFEGFQTQPSGQTVQDLLEKRLSGLLGRPICIAAAGRTDAGVHALAQVIHFDYDTADEPPPVLRRLGGSPSPADIASTLDRALTGASDGASLPSSVHLYQVLQAPVPDFHARSSCTGKRYVYTLREGVGDPFRDRYTWALGRGVRLDVPLMQRAADLIAGEHDFTAFAARTDPRPPVKKMRLLRVERLAGPEGRARASAGGALGAGGREIAGDDGERDLDGNGGGGAAGYVGSPAVAPPVSPFALIGLDDGLVTVTAECDRYLQHMMRFVTGTLVEVGKGRLSLDQVARLVEGGPWPETLPPRQKAPARGLCLHECFYE